MDELRSKYGPTFAPKHNHTGLFVDGALKNLIELPPKEAAEWYDRFYERFAAHFSPRWEAASEGFEAQGTLEDFLHEMASTHLWIRGRTPKPRAKEIDPSALTSYPTWEVAANFTWEARFEVDWSEDSRAFVMGLLGIDEEAFEALLAKRPRNSAQAMGQFR